MGEYLSCFKAYDVRGKVPSELNPEIAYAIGRAYARTAWTRYATRGIAPRLTNGPNGPKEE